MLRIGRHINISKGFTTAPGYAKSLGCTFFQVFLSNPERISSKPRPMAELEAFGEELKDNKLKMVVHASYTINLCHPPGSVKYENSVKAIVQDVQGAETIGERCVGVIIHMGKNIKSNKLSEEEAVNNYIMGLKDALRRTESGTIILETGASQGTEVCSSLEGLAFIWKGLTKSQQKRVRFCIDTCHIWATGYDISDKKAVKKFFGEFDALIGIDKIACVHFNNSQTVKGSHVDRHADLKNGIIPEEGIIAFAKMAAKHEIPLVMETPLVDTDTKRELKMIRSWLKV